MTQIDNSFKVKKGLDVTGNANFVNNVTVLGTINVPNQAQTDNSTKAANTAFVKQAVADLVAAAPGALDTLNELATALGNDSNFATNVNASIALKAPIANPSFTGVPLAPTAAVVLTNTDQIATTKFVQNQKASPTFTGVPLAPTALPDTNTTQIATTAFVLAQAAIGAPLMNGVQSVGGSYRYARQDHIHPSDTTKANLAGDTFTGAVSFTSITTSGDVTMYGPKVLQSGNDHLILQSVAANKDIILKTNGVTDRFRLKAGGNLLLGTGVVDNGVDLLQVSGTVSATAFKGGAALTGTPTAPNAAAGLNNTQIANTAYVDTGLALKANLLNPTFTGNVMVSGGIASADFTYAAFVNGGSYITTTQTVTGAFKITLPVLYSNTMMQFTVRVYEYGMQRSFDLVVSGYNYSSTSSWYNTSAYIVGDALCKTPNVRFGNDGSKCCIWIGELDTNWDYPQINIKDVKIGFNGQSASWLSGWSIAPVTTFDAVKNGPQVPFKASGVDSPTFIGIPRAPTAAAGNNSTQIATTAYVDVADALKAPLASPALTGTPTAPTAAPGTNTTQIATTQFVSTAVSNLVGTAPATLDTLKELSDALGGDNNFATTMATSLSNKAPLASPALTGTPTAPTAAVDTNTQQLATTAFVVNQGYAKTSGNYAPLASPTFTGVPTAPTAANSTLTAQVATTQFVYNAITSLYTKSIAGGANVTLSTAEAINQIIYLTGAITANIVVTFPNITGRWVIVNTTSGGFSVTVKTATGVGVVVAQSYASTIACNSVDMFMTQSDLTNAYIAGNPTTTTQASTDNSTRVATTAFVKAQNYLISTSTIDGGSF